MDIFDDIIKSIDKRKIKNQKQLNRLKIELAKKYRLKQIPTNAEILFHAKDMSKYKNLLAIKPVRTLSGVNVVAVMSKPALCPHVRKGIGPCIMCPGGLNSVFGDVPQSYTGKEPATRRAIRNKFDPYLQAFNRLEHYIAMNKIPEKIEVIIMGGTFPSLTRKYQENFVMYCFKAMNDFSELFFKKGRFDFGAFKKFYELPGKINDEERTERIHTKCLRLKKKKTTLRKEQKRNETANARCVALVLETRPDYAKLKQANEMLKLGCTRVELGAQTVYNNILKKINRGHTVEDTIEATKVLKDLGFKISYHVMPGLPGVARKQDINGLKEFFRNPAFRPDMLKIYPCMVLKGTNLYKMWKKGRYKPLTTKKAAEIIAEFKRHIPPYVRVSRVQRDIPTYLTEAGVDKTNLRQYVHQLMKQKGIKCRCIRCREPGSRKISKINVKNICYEASEGLEFFISAESKDTLLGFCRLRFPSKSLRKEINDDSALIRELHVYGAAEQIGRKGEIQHRGIGKLLMNIAQTTSKTYYKNRIVVISGVGAREYFKKLGYKKEGPYMVKKV